ncbi:FecCD family ABC transporter permease (plasmid) [Streptomyces sp. BI20]|uniref:FecCD family ABC transporter permease n=1 Tax=Streptomyces sp. BI20 TaxID=3403460 RepID=UPI003C795769
MPHSPTRPAAARAEALAVLRAGRRARRVRRWTVPFALGAGLLLVFTTALCVGDLAIPPGEVFAALTGGGDPGTHFVVVELRLPRVVLGLLVGVAFGLSGSLFQALLRNPLASPDVIGISQGASAAAVLASLGFAVSGIALSGAALAGALLAAALIHVLARRGQVSGARFVLVGVGIGAALSGITSYLLTRSEVAQAQNALVWLTGSLNGSTVEQVWPLAAALVVLLPLTVLASRDLEPLRLGEDTAAGLGSPVARARFCLLGCAVALAGVATAAAGPIAFVAFVSGPIARRLAPTSGAALVPAALTGALLVTAADFAAQHLLWSSQFPVGVVTGLIGAPCLLWLLARAHRTGRLG